MAYKSGEDFLDKIYTDMRNSAIVNHTALKSDKPEDKIKKYVDRLERIHEEADKHNKLDLIKKYYYDRYVIKELPESYINLQKKIAREEGYGDIRITDEFKQKLLLNVQKDQKASLDNWLNYFMSEDAMYPSWFKVYAFQGMLKLGKFDKEKGEFGRRTDSTIEPYLDFNREILARVYDTLKKYIGKEELSDEELNALSHGESFKKLYTYYLKCTNNTFKADGTDGIWIKYDQGDNYEPLWASLQGKNTGWCTAGRETAKVQVKNGDFYVYYTKDENGEYKNPRIAIRMEGKYHIGEIRGVSKNQNLEPEMNEILEAKLEEFPDKNDYLKKVHDMKLLTEINHKIQNNVELSRDDLIFVYELNDRIAYFGWGGDPRVGEILLKRHHHTDFNLIFDYDYKDEDPEFFEKYKSNFLLASIDKKTNNNVELTKDELIFLYTMDNNDNGERFKRYLKAENIINKRDISKDLKIAIDGLDPIKYKDAMLITQIDDKINNNEELTRDELIFLYEVKRSINCCFAGGYDPRIRIIKTKRDKYEDLNTIFENCEGLDPSFETNIILTGICRKHLNGEELTKDELFFLYEINKPINTILFRKDPRIEMIKESRNLNKDLAYMFDCKEENVASSYDDFEGNDIILYYGSFEYTMFCAHYDKNLLNHLKYIIGNFDNHHIYDDDGKGIVIDDITNLDNLLFISGNLAMPIFTASYSFPNLEHIGGDLVIIPEFNCSGFGKLKYIGGSAKFSRLDTTKGLENLEYLGGDIVHIGINELNPDIVERIPCFKNKIHKRNRY